MQSIQIRKKKKHGFCLRFLHLIIVSFNFNIVSTAKEKQKSKIQMFPQN